MAATVSSSVCTPTPTPIFCEADATTTPHPTYDVEPILLTFQQQQIPLFDIREESSLFTDKEHLFIAPLSSFMEALQEKYQLECDISLYFPQLQLTFHSHTTFAEKLSLSDLYLLGAVALSKDQSKLHIHLIEEKNNFIAQYHALLRSTEEFHSSEEEKSASEEESESTTSMLFQTGSKQSTEGILVKRKEKAFAEDCPPLKKSCMSNKED